MKKSRFYMVLKIKAPGLWVQIPRIGYLHLWGYIGKATRSIRLRRKDGSICLGGFFVSWGRA